MAASVYHSPVVTRIAHSVFRAALIFAILLSAAMTAAALARPTHTWVGWLTLLPLLAAVRVFPPGQAAFCGGLWGAAFFCFSALNDTSVVQPNLTSLAALTGVPAAYLLLGCIVTRRVGFSAVVLGFTWLLVELALAPIAGGNGLLAGTQGDGILATGVGGLLGSVFVGFFIAFINSAFLAILGRVRLRWLPASQVLYSIASRSRHATRCAAARTVSIFIPVQSRAPPGPA